MSTDSAALNPIGTERYRRSWSDYLKRRMRYYIAFFGLPAWVALVYWLYLFFELPNAAMIILVGPWLVFALIAGFSYAFWKCPRCEKLFHMSWYSNMFARKCLHCGLRKADMEAAWASPSAEAP